MTGQEHKPDQNFLFLGSQGFTNRNDSDMLKRCNYASMFDVFIQMHVMHH